MILSEESPLTIVGGAEVDLVDLNIVLKHAPIAVAADSGADHLLANDTFPAAVIGDFDSISDRAREMFADRLNEIKDQDTTDFEKVVASVSAPLLLGVGFLGGRLDHIIATLSVLGRFAERPIILVSSEEVVFALRNGKIDLPIGAGCAISILPFENCVATSRGLEWDLDESSLQMAGTVSSSNRAAADRVELEVQGTAIVTVAKSALPAVIAAVRGK